MPEQAWWSDKEHAWMVGGSLRRGNLHGSYKEFRQDGTLGWDGVYKNGRLHGPYSRFHQNGEVAQKGENLNGRRNGVCTWHRSTEPTTENIELFAPLNPDIWTVKTTYKNGVMVRATQYYRRDGVEVSTTADPLPHRPKQVPATATYIGDEQTWFDGRMEEPDANRSFARIRGVRRWWNPKGKLLQEQDHTRAPKLVWIRKYTYYSNGQLETERMYRSDDTLELIRPVLEKIYRNGRLFTKRSYKKTKKGLCRSYINIFRPDGSLCAEGPCDGHLATGLWIFRDKHGHVTEQANLCVLRLPFSDPLLEEKASTVQRWRKIRLPRSLRGIMRIQWKRFHTSDCPYAEHIPLYMRGLLSKFDKDRALALDALRDQISFWGNTPSPPAPVVVPYLLRLISETHELAGIPGFLSFLATLSGGAHVVRQLAANQETFAQVRKPTRQVRSAVVKALPLWLHLLKQADSTARRGAAVLIALVRSKASRSLSMLWDAFRDEADDLARSEMALSLGVLLNASDCRLTELVSIAQNEKQPELLRLCAALTVARLKKQRMERNVLNALIRGFKCSSTLESSYRGLYWGSQTPLRVDILTAVKPRGISLVRNLCRAKLPSRTQLKAWVAKLDDDPLVDSVCGAIAFREAWLVKLLPTGFQRVHAVRLLDREVLNGGFSQFFWNWNGAFAFEAYQCFRKIGARTHANHLAGAMRAFVKAQPKLKELRSTTGYRAWYEELSKSEVNELDCSYFDLENITGKLARYIRSHANDFMA